MSKAVKTLKSLVAKIENIQEELDSVRKDLESTIITTGRSNNSKLSIILNSINNNNPIVNSCSHNIIKNKKVKNKETVKNRNSEEDLFPDYSLAKNQMKYTEEDFVFRDEDEDVAPPPKTTKSSTSGKKKNQAELFEEKIKENRIDELNSPDLVRYFRQCAEKRGIRYVSNWGKDASIMKKLLEDLTPLEIIGMIDFLFYSKQTYLEKSTLGVGVFSGGWLNKIYQDTQLWLDDKYTETKKTKSDRQRQSDWSDEETSIGELGG